MDFFLSFFLKSLSSTDRRSIYNTYNNSQVAPPHHRLVLYSNPNRPRERKEKKENLLFFTFTLEQVQAIKNRQEDKLPRRQNGPASL
jgi:hypothetical protein